MAFSRISGNNFTNFLWAFLLDRILSMILPFSNFYLSSQSFPPFYSVVLESQGNYWVPCFALWVPKYVLCPSPTRFNFPVLHSFLPFSFVSLKVHGWLPISEYAEVTLFSIQLLVVLLLYLFSQTGGIPLCRFESLLLLLPFLYFFILVPRGATHLRYERSLILSSFSCWVVWRLRRTWPLLCFLCFFLYFSFELS